MIVVAKVDAILVLAFQDRGKVSGGKGWCKEQIIRLTPARRTAKTSLAKIVLPGLCRLTTFGARARRSWRSPSIDLRRSFGLRGLKLGVVEVAIPRGEYQDNISGCSIGSLKRA